ASPNSCPHGDAATDTFVQVCLGPAPVRLEEAVGAVPWDQHRLDPGSDLTGQRGDRRPADQELSDLGEVVASQPEAMEPAGITGVVREHDDSTSDTAHLTQACDRVRPVMNGGERHRSVEGL